MINKISRTEKKYAKAETLNFIGDGKFPSEICTEEYLRVSSFSYPEVCKSVVFATSDTVFGIYS